MTTLHSKMRDILIGVEMFLTKSLKHLKISASVETEKQGILKKIESLREEFPVLFGEVSKGEEESSPPSAQTKEADNAESNGLGTEVKGVQEEPAPRIVDVFLKDLEEPLKQGFLTKRKGKKKGLFDGSKRYYVALSKSIMFGYEKKEPANKKQKWSLDVRGFEARIVEDVHKKEFSFQLVAPAKKTQFFSAASEEDLNSWISLLNIASDSTDEDIDNLYATADEISQSSKQLSSTDEPEDDLNESDLSKDDDGGEFYDDAFTETSQDIPKVKSQRSIQETDNISDVNATDIDQQGSGSDSIPLDPTVTTELVEPDFSNAYYCLWPCQSDAEDELSFHQGDILHIVSKKYNDSCWWIGKLNDKFGLVPKNYLKQAYQVVT